MSLRALYVPQSRQQGQLNDQGQSPIGVEATPLCGRADQLKQLPLSSLLLPDTTGRQRGNRPAFHPGKNHSGLDLNRERFHPLLVVLLYRLSRQLGQELPLTRLNDCVFGCEGWTCLIQSGQCFPFLLRRIWQQNRLQPPTCH